MGLFDFFKREEPRAKADRLVLDDEEELEVEDELEVEEGLRDKEAPEDREENGPFDEADDHEAGNVIDFGAIQIPVVEGLGLRLEVQEKTKRLVAIALDYGESSVQVQAFATPRSSGLWASVREQLVEQLAKQGGTAEERETDLGTVLHAKVPVIAGGKPERRVEFIGVDGPRWFLRGVITGQATVDDEARDKLYEIFRGLTVVRGAHPVPPRDLLPLQVPEAMAQQMAAAQAAAQQQQAAPPTPEQRTAQLAQQKVREQLLKQQNGGEK